jgi:hypothetical protein
MAVYGPVRLRVLQSPPPIKLKILSKMALNTIKQTKQILYYDKVCEFEFRPWRGVPYHDSVRVVVFNASFNNIAVISWGSGLLV